jgi:DNA replication and repair protein RecF
MEEVDFSPEINLITGLNGSGKTNILDALYCLCIGKSAFCSVESHLITHEKPFMSVLGFFYKNNKEYEIRYDVQKGSKKSILLNGKAYDRISDHIGAFPLVIIHPDDQRIIRDGAEERRRFFDQLFCQIDHEYIDLLLKYLHFVKQRNALLKSWNENPSSRNISLLETYDATLIPLNKALYEKRCRYVAEFMIDFDAQYQKLNGGKEVLSIKYQSDVQNPAFKEVFRKNRDRDEYTEKTGKGIHKDEFLFMIHEQLIKTFASQGQQKTFIIALKLAQIGLMKKYNSTSPILLLDDIFDKLDDERILHLIQNIAGTTNGQIFITDARPERSIAIIKLLNREIRILNVENGQITTLS